ARTSWSSRPRTRCDANFRPAGSTGSLSRWWPAAARGSVCFSQVNSLDSSPGRSARSSFRPWRWPWAFGAEAASSLRYSIFSFGTLVRQIMLERLISWELWVRSCRRALLFSSSLSPRRWRSSQSRGENDSSRISAMRFALITKPALGCVSCLAILTMASVHGQDAVVDRIVVEADRLPNAESGAPFSIHVVDENDLRRAPQLRLDDILRTNVPG